MVAKGVPEQTALNHSQPLQLCSSLLCSLFMVFFNENSLNKTPKSAFNSCSCTRKTLPLLIQNTKGYAILVAYKAQVPNFLLFSHQNTRTMYYESHSCHLRKTVLSAQNVCLRAWLAS